MKKKLSLKAFTNWMTFHCTYSNAQSHWCPVTRSYTFPQYPHQHFVAGYPPLCPEARTKNIGYIKFLPILILASLISCQQKEMKSIGSIERFDPSLDAIISKDAKIEVIAEGFEWSEGPLWIENKKMLLFSDVPTNTVYKWTEDNGTEVYLKPSGYTGTVPRGGEPGSNGLALDSEGYLILCQHGDRRVVKMNAPLAQPTAEFIPIAYEFIGKRFNSPNDVVFNNNNFYFTDPPYGLVKQMEDSSKEIPFQGVYQLTSNKKTLMLIDSLTRPNGLAFSPDSKKLYIANSDPEKAMWYEYELNPFMQIISGKVFYNATTNAKIEKGLPDGLKVDSRGNIFATGPGGVWVFDSTGKLLGKIKLPEAASNCALSSDDKTLFVTNDMNILRIQLRK